jgi:hypothetical protein
MGLKNKESCHEEIIAVSADPFCIMNILFFIRSVTDMRHKPQPTTATPALEPSAPEEPAPKEETTLPDPSPPEPQQPEASAGGEKQVEATDATPVEGTSKCLTIHG